MYIHRIRKLKFNLWALILTILAIISLIFTIVHIASSANASTSANYSKDLSAVAKTNFANSNNNIVQSVTSTKTTSTQPKSNNTLPSNQVQQEKPVLSLNNHTYKIDSNMTAYVQSNSKVPCVVVQSNSYTYKLCTETQNYSELQNRSDLHDFLESKYDVKITSNIKTGNYNSMDFIIFTIKDHNDLAYFVITPLNFSETLCTKIYNTNNKSILVDNLEKPLDELSSLKRNSIF